MSRENPLSSRAQKALRTARGFQPEAPTYLKTRVLAELEEKRKKAPSGKEFLFWKLWASASTLLLLVGAIYLLRPVSDIEVKVGSPVALQVQMEEFSEVSIAAMRIQLPDKMQFYSEKYPFLADERELKIPWSNELDEEGFPIVVKAEESGKRAVRIEFLDEKGEPLHQKEILLKVSSQEVEG